ncbi:MAG: WG repeat-containing protein [Cyanobacteria bacterium TGS_CYA1]|nr:WG repeat-containing protein [Cyanobacteria bacterium TGS_CYA1]
MNLPITVIICAATALISASLIYYFVFPRLPGVKLAGKKIVGGIIFAPLQGTVTAAAFGIALYFSTVTSIFTALGGGVAAVPLIFTLSLGITAVILFFANLALIVLFKALNFIIIDGKYGATQAVVILMVTQVTACIIVGMASSMFIKVDSNFTLFDDSYSYIDTKGRVAINQKFDSAMPFKNGVAEVARLDSPSSKIFIDKTGKEVPAPKTEKPKRKFTFDDDPELYESDETVSLSPDTTIQTHDFEMTPFSEGLAIARELKKGGDWGFVDSSFHFKIPCKFSAARHFKDGLAAVEVSENGDRNWGFIDKSGAFVIPPKFTSAKSFHDGLALVSVNVSTKKVPHDGYGYIDKTGKFVIEPKYEFASSFSEGLASVRKRRPFY